MIDSWRRQVLDSCPGLVLVSWGTLLVGVGGIDFAISKAETHGLVILGMEGFRTDGQSMIPLVDYVADLGAIDGTWAQRVRRSRKAASAVVAAWAYAPDFIEFVLAEPVS